MPTPNRPKPTARFGTKRAGITRRLRAGIIADEAVPTDRLAFLSDLDLYSSVQWVLVMPVGVTGYSASFYRMVEDGTGAIEEIVKDETVAATETLVYYQPLDVQPVFARVHDIVGVPGAGFTVLATASNRTAT